MQPRPIQKEIHIFIRNTSTSIRRYYTYNSLDVLEPIVYKLLGLGMSQKLSRPVMFGFVPARPVAVDVTEIVPATTDKISPTEKTKYQPFIATTTTLAQRIWNGQHYFEEDGTKGTYLHRGRAKSF
jgi:hypothetical protein